MIARLPVRSRQGARPGSVSAAAVLGWLQPCSAACYRKDVALLCVGGSALKLCAG